jgi:hypothetical protein
MNLFGPVGWAAWALSLATAPLDCGEGSLTQGGNAPAESATAILPIAAALRTACATDPNEQILPPRGRQAAKPRAENRRSAAKRPLPYKIRVIEPDPDVDYKMIVVKPDPAVDCKIVVIDPLTKQEVDRRRSSLGLLRHKLLQEQTPEAK